MDHYKIGSVIGEGSSAVVNVGVEIVSGRRVALKKGRRAGLGRSLEVTALEQLLECEVNDSVSVGVCLQANQVNVKCSQQHFV